MITINKYELVSVIDLISGTKVAELLKLPTGARVLSVGVQNNKVCAWVLLDNEAPTTNDVYVQFEVSKHFGGNLTAFEDNYITIID